MTDAAIRPFSTSSSVISPYAALEALAGGESSTLSFRPSGSSPHRSSRGSSRGGGGGRDHGDQRPLTPMDDDGDMPFLVRARFGFQATDNSALSFAAGDLIQVFRKLESGWWDGMLDGKRGWFPSNYVEDIAEEEIAHIEDEERQARDLYGEPPEGYNVGGPTSGGTEDDVLRMDDVLRGGWGDWGGDTGLDQLAREMMAGDDGEEEDDGRAFAEEARRRRAQAEGVVSGADEFGVSSRRREETDATIRPSGASTTSSTTTTTQLPSARKQRESVQGQPQDAWIPSITPDGQVYYHNTQTGEDSWDLPTEGLGPEEEQVFAQNDDGFFAPTRASSSAMTSASPLESLHDNDFRPPPKAQLEIPYPWVAKLSDDGREWFYYNRLTGQSRKDPPVTKGDATSMTEVGVGMKRLSVGNGSRPMRASVELQRKAVDDWERKTAEALRAVIQADAPPTMGALMDNVNDALREIFEASVAGSAAEEEMSRAEDLGSEAGMIAAVIREENGVDMLASAHRNTLAAIRQLLSSFGYVGPLDRMEEMPRPPWVGDMTLIGSIGLLSANTHAAITSKRMPESGLSIWAEVLRSASKVKDVIANFPQAALAGQVIPAGIDSAVGQRTKAWLGFNVLGEPLGGKWGFGRTEIDLRPWDQAAVVDCQKIRSEFEAAMQDPSDDSSLQLIRLATRFNELVNQLDIASVIDVDGDNGDLGNGVRAREDDLREYDHLVEQARQAIFDLDNSTRLIQTACVHLLSKLGSADVQNAAESLAGAVTTAFRALPTLLIISGEQAAAAQQGLIRGQIGIRSPKVMTARQSFSTRPTSIVSSSSRASRSGPMDVKRNRVRGLEEEFLDANDYGEARDQALQMPVNSTSASASTTSLAPQHSRASSVTSLTYQPTESDSGSQKGSRTSILKAFRRNRADSDADGRGSTRGKTPSKKLAKLLGEDVSAIPINATVPPPALPETPWYLSDDFAPGEIIFDDKGGVKAGSLKALVVRLTQHSSTDTPFFQAFLLTFRSFTNAHELFDHLVERYNIAQPEGLNHEQSHEWRVKKQAPIRLRVANALRTWLERHYIEQTDQGVLNRIEEFANTTLLANGSELMSKQLLTLVGKRRQGEPEQTRGSASGSLLSPPAPLLPRVAGRQLRLTDVAPLEIARQLTIIEFLHFQRIKPSECLNRAWADENTGSINAPNVRNVILTANRMAGWVALHILSSKDTRQRATAMKILIQVAVECRNLNNFSSMAGIVAGLNSAPITRLKRTKELLSAKTQNMKADLDRTLDSTKNFANYRDMLKTINPPCVPFFGFYLSALTFIEDGNKNFIQPGGPGSAVGPGGVTKGLSTSGSSSSLSTGLSRSLHPSSSSLSGSTNSVANYANASASANPVQITQPLINFFKRALNAEILRDIAQYQSQPYNLARCKPVLEWIMRGLDEVEKGGDLYEISQALEPREKEEERITRMLHDSVSGVLWNGLFVY
ncbi:hypothetical protein I317_05665 [Kwoniella heveanensis CBS 569]|nr:hypothetical protein I317_05665 [Kwoniella heveanensis CBS 569]